MNVYGHMIGQAHICPGKSNEDKTFHIPLEIIGTKYDGIHSCSLRVVDFESLSPPTCATYIVDPDASRVNDASDLFDLVWCF